MVPMKILLVGGGGRECAIAKAIRRSSRQVKLYSAMKNRNPHIARLSDEVNLIVETDIGKVVTWAKEKGAEMAIIGPEDPLARGLADGLLDAGIGCVGPKMESAQLEVSKSFARNLMAKHKIPGRVRYRIFTETGDLAAYLRDYDGGFVVKPAGLTAGKGVKILGEQLKNMEDALKYAEDILLSKPGGIPEVIIEEKVDGVEFTLQTFCDGRNVVPMPAVHDHKRAYDGDTGPNTGGMGSYSDSDRLLPFVTQTDYNDGLGIIRKTVDALRKDGLDYRGIIYGQFMATGEDVKVIEFNVRFGDPEAMNVLSTLASDFVDICGSIVDGNLPQSIKFDERATVCKYVVPKGYGTNPVVGAQVLFDEEAIMKIGAELYFAAVNEENGKIYTTTSRSAGVVGFGDSIAEAEKMSEEALKHVSGEYFARHDIGKIKSIRTRTDKMKVLREKASTAGRSCGDFVDVSDD